MSRLAASPTFKSLAVRNFRLYFVGQLPSQAGTWMTRIALTLLMLDLTDGSGVAIGVLAACQFGPVLLLVQWAGAIADRSDKWRLMYWFQAAGIVPSAVLAVLVVADAVTPLVLMVAAFAKGVVLAFENPTRRSMIAETVELDSLTNAISLSSAAMTSARVIGPALGGVVIATLGYSWCFALDAASYVVLLAAMRRMDRTALLVSPKVERARGQVLDGLRYVWSNPELRVVLVAMSAIGALTFNVAVTVPLLVRWMGGSDVTFTMVYSAMSVGSVCGALVGARRQDPGAHDVVRICVLYGAAMTGLAVAPGIVWLYPAGVLVGLTSILFLTLAGSVLQVGVRADYRGRVTALQTLAFMGTAPIGGPILGVVSDLSNPRVAVVLGAATCFVAAAYAARALRRAGTVGEAAGVALPR